MFTLLAELAELAAAAARSYAAAEADEQTRQMQWLRNNVPNPFAREAK